MNLCGLTDSLATLHAASDECPRCHLNSRVAHGLCLGCLLQAGIESKESVNLDEFDAALAAVAVPDTNWRLGNYEILEEIGRGGMGVIYRARQRHSRRIVALKRVLSYHADSRETLVRFRREAEAAASLDHPNILPIYEVGESDDGVPFFSMKYASGGSLQEVGPALRGDPREIVGLMAKVTRAVQHAHRQGILHRDLKPGNILLDGRGEPLVSDFGLAKWLDASSDITRTLTIFGTPGYIAPEQAEGGAADLKSTADVYSLGAILFDLLAGDGSVDAGGPAQAVRLAVQLTMATAPQELSTEFAVFPLTGALMLPRGKLPLNIFEPRYLRMIDDALASGRVIGMLQPDPSRPATPTGPALYRIGCLGRLSSFSETDDGRYLITLTGLTRFQVQVELEMNRGYRRVRADLGRFKADLDDPEPGTVERKQLLDALTGYFAAQRIDANWEAIEDMPDDALVTTLAMVCPFEAPEKQAMLEAPSPAERAATLLMLLQMGAHAASAGGDGRRAT